MPCGENAAVEECRYVVGEGQEEGEIRCKCWDGYWYERNHVSVMVKAYVT